MLAASRLTRSLTFGACCLALAMTARTANAGSVQLSTGWLASWDDSLNGLVDIVDVAQVGNIGFIQKAAQFLEGPDGSGVFPSIEILFTQTAANAVSTFVIQDELLTNMTGADWTDFHMELVGSGAAFDPVATANSPGPAPIGFTIDPFLQAQFVNGDTRLDIFDGLVADGSTWNPGSGVSDGDLFFDVVTTDGISAPFAQFTLIETPTPEPATAVLLMTGALAVCYRRRK